MEESLMYDLPWSRIIFDILWPGFLETLWMMLGSTIACFILGMLIAVALVTTGPRGIKPNRVVYETISTIVGIIYSVPYVILAIALVPSARLLMGTSIGVAHAIFTIAISATPWIARLFEAALKEVSPSLVEAARSFGASNRQITSRVIINEAVPALISQMVLAVIIILGFTAIAGTIGAGGLGGVALTYGYQNFNSEIMYSTVAIMIVMVIIIQLSGNALYRKFK
jgi:D-methionine transport system permease protein